MTAPVADDLRALLERWVRVAASGHWRDKAGLSIEAHLVYDDTRAALAAPQGAGDGTLPFDLKTVWDRIAETLRLHDCTARMPWGDRNSIAGAIAMAFGYEQYPAGDNVPAPAADAVERVYQEIALAYTRETGGADLGRRVGEAMATAALSALPSPMHSAPADAVERLAETLKISKLQALLKIVVDARENYDRKDTRQAYNEFKDYYDQLHAALSTDSAKDGWVLVPREPTEAMLVAGSHRHDDFFTEKGVYPRTKAVYRAMLSAAPQADDGGKK